MWNVSTTIIIASAALLTLPGAGPAVPTHKAAVAEVNARPCDLGSKPVDAPFFAASSRPDATLVIFVHGGAWSRGDKVQAEPLAPAFVSHGFAFAAVNYRLFPKASVSMQAQDVCASVEELRTHGAQLHFDPHRIILVGHSAGAQLAALLAPRLHAEALVLLDPVGVSVADEISRTPHLKAIFGDNASGWASVSPADEALGGAVFPPTFIAYTNFRPDTAPQSQVFAAAVKRRQPDIRVKAYPGLRHGNFFMNLSYQNDISTDVFAFLAEVTGSGR